MAAPWDAEGGRGGACGGVLQAVSLKNNTLFTAPPCVETLLPSHTFTLTMNSCLECCELKLLCSLMCYFLSLPPPLHIRHLSVWLETIGVCSAERKKKEKHNRLHTMYAAYILHSLTRQTECKWLLLSQAMNIISTGALSTLGGCLQETWSCYVHQWGVSFWAIGGQRTHQLGSSNA